MRPEDLLDAFGALDDALIGEAMLLPGEETDNGLAVPLPEPAAPAGRKRILLRYAAAAAVFVLLLAGVRIALSRLPKTPARTDGTSFSSADGSDRSGTDASKGETAFSDPSAGNDGAATAGEPSSGDGRRNASTEAQSHESTRRQQQTAEEPAATVPGSRPAGAAPSTTKAAPGGVTRRDTTQSGATSRNGAEKTTRADADVTTTKGVVTKAPTVTEAPSATAKAPTTRRSQTQTTSEVHMELPTAHRETTTAAPRPADQPQLFDFGLIPQVESTGKEDFFTRFVRVFGADGSGSGAGNAHGQEVTIKAPEQFTTAAQQEPTSRTDSPEIDASAYKEVSFFAFADRILNTEAELKKNAVFEEKSAAELAELYDGACLPADYIGTEKTPVSVSQRHGVYHVAGEDEPVLLNRYQLYWTSSDHRIFHLMVYAVKDDGVHLPFPTRELEQTEAYTVLDDAEIFFRSSADAIGPAYTALAKRGDTVLWLTLSGNCTQREFLRMVESCFRT